MKKRLVFCFDGTWNRLSSDTPTNVVKLAQMVMPTAPDGTPQIVHYDEGIGTDSRLNRWTGGIFGHGMEAILRKAYLFLIFNYAPGDEIYAFGFSRGAYTARSFIGLVRHAGSLDAAFANQIDKAIEIYRNAPAGQVGTESKAAIAFRFKNCTGVCVSEEDRQARQELYAEMSDAGRKIYPRDPAKTDLIDIRFLGVWDTVRALGAPDFLPGSRWLNAKYAFHDAVLTSKIKVARHAVAIDEPRLTFRPTLFGAKKVAELNARAADGKGEQEAWKLPYQEVWFPGVHSAIGGGGARRGLSDIALTWILRGARDAGLAVRLDGTGPMYSLSHNPYQELESSATLSWYQKGPLGWLARRLHRPRQGPAQRSDLHLATLQRWYSPAENLPGKREYRPPTLEGMRTDIDGWPYRPVWPPLPEGVPHWGEHIVLANDTLGTIAKQYLGESKRWREIWDINRDRIEDPDDLDNGLVLRVPEAAQPPLDAAAA